MGKIHQLFAAILAASVVSAAMPASAAQEKTAHRQTLATTGAVEHSDTNRENLHTAQGGNERSSTKTADRPHKTAKLLRSAKGKAIRRAIAIRRARVAKAKKGSKQVDN